MSDWSDPAPLRARIHALEAEARSLTDTALKAIAQREKAEAALAAHHIWAGPSAVIWTWCPFCKVKVTRAAGRETQDTSPRPGVVPWAAGERPAVSDSAAAKPAALGAPFVPPLPLSADGPCPCGYGLPHARERRHAEARTPLGPVEKEQLKQLIRSAETQECGT
jgi:hypothetical protein